ncbi:15378_t:CDS:2, partial [Acaulospora morrowiae]
MESKIKIEDYTKGSSKKDLAVKINKKLQDSIWNFLLIDVDDLKKINTAHGQSGGDDALNKLRTIMEVFLTKYFRLKNLDPKRDIIPARYGGDEFIIVINAENIDGLKFAKTLRAYVEKFFEFREEKHTVSIGFSSSANEQTFNDLYYSASKGLTLAKSNGKNRVEVLRLNESEDSLTTILRRRNDLKKQWEECNKKKELILKEDNLLKKKLVAIYYRGLSDESVSSHAKEKNPRTYLQSIHQTRILEHGSSSTLLIHILTSELDVEKLVMPSTSPNQIRTLTSSVTLLPTPQSQGITPKLPITLRKRKDTMQIEEETNHDLMLHPHLPNAT